MEYIIRINDGRFGQCREEGVRLGVIDTLVFKEKKVSMDELMMAFDAELERL